MVTASNVPGCTGSIAQGALQPGKIARPDEHFRQPGQLEQKHVPGFAQLGKGRYFFEETLGMGGVEDNQLFHRLRMAHGKVPGDRPPQSCPTTTALCSPAWFDYAQHIVKQGFQPVMPDPFSVCPRHL